MTMIMIHLSCGNASTCNLSPIECMAGDYKINLDAIFGEKTDLKKWYVEIEANGKCSDGSNYTQKFTAGKNLSAQLNSSQISLEFYPTNASELFVGRDITFYLTIREPCREHTEDCILCLDNRHRYLNISDARIFATNVRTYQRRAFMLSVNTLGQECGCSL